MVSPSQIEAVLFDHDGVLVASEPLHEEAWARLLESLQIDYQEHDIHAQVGKPAPLILKNLLDLYRPGWTSDQFSLNELALKKNDHYLEIMRTRLAPYPGVREGLLWLKENKIRMAVVSNARSRELHRSLDILSLKAYFDVILSRDDVAAPKPDPRAYLTGATLCGVQPEACVAIEDSPTGIEAALLARTQAVAVLTNFSEETLKQPVPGRPDLRPVKIVPQMTDFFEWLKARISLRSGGAKSH